MSDTTAGLLQVGALVARSPLCYRPLGGYLRRSSPATRTCASSA
jgi:hypothetical protein